MSDTTTQAPPQPAVPDQIAAARQAGYNDDEIAAHLQQSQTFGPKYQAARQAGYNDSDIWGHLGLKTTPTVSVTAHRPSASAAQPEPSTVDDIAHGTNRGLVEGVGSLLGLPGDVVHMVDKGSMWALTKGAEQMGLLSPEVGQQVRDRAGYAPHPLDQLQSEAVTNHLSKLANAAGIDTSEPTGTAGRYAETAASFLPSAMTAGTGSLSNLAKAVTKYAAIPGAVSETAGEATQGTPLEPVARTLGAMAPQAIGSGLSAAQRAVNPVARGIASASPQQLLDAQAILDRSRAAGAPLTVAEAVQAATGSGTRLGDMQRVIEQSPEGGAITRPFFAQRPAQTQALGQSTLDQIAPPTPNPYEVAPRVQGAAQGAVSAADKARTAAVKPLYTAAATDAVPLPDMENFLGKIDGIIARDKTGLLSPEFSRLRDALTETPAQPDQPRVPITDIENLDTARKSFRDQIDQPSVAQDAIPKQVADRMGSLLDELRGMMEDASPDFAAGRQQYEDISQNTVEPLLRSPTGQLAEADTFPKQAAILFNPRPLPGSEAAVGNAMRQVVRADPDAAQQMLRMHLEHIFDKATQTNMSVPNQWGGPKFVTAVMGTGQQAKNLEAMFRALPNGGMQWNAFRRSMGTLEAMGMRQPVGSQTEYNRQIREAMERGTLPLEFATQAASPSRWISMAHDVYRQIAYGQNTRALAKVLTQGDVSDLRELAGAPARTWRAQAALIGALGREGALSTPSPEAQPP